MNLPARMLLALLLPGALPEPAHGKRLLNLIFQDIPEFSPELIQNYEPIKTPFTTVDNALEFWRPPLLWKRKSSIKCQGSIWMGDTDTHTALYLRTEAKKIQLDVLLKFMFDVTKKFNVHLGYIHLITPREIECVPYNLRYPLDIGMTTHDLRKGIPILPWATVYGKPYVEMLGIDAFLNAPAHTVIRLPDDRVYIQITESLDDLRTDYENFANRRAAVTDHLSCLFQGSQVGVKVPPEIMSPIIV